MRKVVVRVLVVFAGLVGLPPAVMGQVETAWMARYDGTGGSDMAWKMTVDDAGNAYVTGTSSSRANCFFGCGDFATVKFSPDGERIWAARRNGPAGGQDGGNQVAVDHEGNVYVGGYVETDASFGNPRVIKYDADGKELWLRETGGNAALTLDASAESFYVLGSAGELGAALLKYDADGTQLWAAPFVEPASGSSCEALALGPDGSPHVSGVTPDPEGTPSYATAKYDPAGNLIWVASLPCSIAGGSRVAVDPSGNVFLAGTVLGEANDAVVVKYDKDGKQLWTATYAGPEQGDDVAKALALDGAGNAYLACDSLNGPSGQEGVTSRMVVLKYGSGAGSDPLWTAEYGAPEQSFYVQDMAVDLPGNIYLLGGSGSVTIKFGADGRLVWAMPKDPLEPVIGWPSALALDAKGNVYIAGYSSFGSVQDGGTSYDYVTIKYKQTIPSFLRGDAGADGTLNLADPVFTLSHLFRSGPAPSCLDAADADDNGRVQITDAVFTLNYLFLGGPPLPAPTASCGPDPKDDGLGCASYAACGGG